MTNRLSLRQAGEKIEDCMTNNSWYNLVGRNFACTTTSKAKAFVTSKSTTANRNIGWGLAGMVAGLSLMLLGIALRKPCGRLASALVTCTGVGVSLVPLFLNVLPGLYVKARKANSIF